MKCLVTGFLGFIGSNLCKKLVSRGHEVYGVDNLQTGVESNKVKGVTHVLLNRIGVSGLVENKVGRFGYDIRETIKSDWDVIYHLGMPSTSPLYKKNRYNVVNCIESTMNVFEEARRARCPVVYASSSSLYNGFDPLHTEDTQPLIMDWYTEARYFVERLAKMYYKLYDVDSVGMRIFSCYGDKDAGKKEFANVVTQFALDMIKGKRPLLYGDGSQSRDFTHVKDVVKAFIVAGEKLKKQEINSHIINVGTGDSFSFKEAVDIINNTLGTNIKPQYTENQIHNYVFTTQADTDTMETELGFKGESFMKAFPKYVKQLKEGMK